MKQLNKEEQKRIYMREYARKRRAIDPIFVQKAREANRKARAKKADQRNAEVKEWKANNKEKVSQYNKEYSKKNRELLNKKACERNKVRRKNDPIYALVRRERVRISNALKSKSKADKTQNLLGCSYSFLKSYVETLFVENMGWHNMGEWHIDHIKPLASFDLSNECEQKLAFHYTNLQPLWAIDNLKKGAKYA